MFVRGLWKGAGVYNVEQFDRIRFWQNWENRDCPGIEKFDLDLEV